MRCLRALVLALACSAGVCCAAELTREQALAAAGQPDADARLAAVERLADVGEMPDTDRLVGRLRDTDPRVRTAATAALWQIWGRSGDAAIDALFARGVAQMQASAFDEALATFSEIVARRPDFAEGWNKRATVYFLLGENQKSLRDCDEVFKRNPNHFGALSGAGQIHLKLGDPERALEFFRRALQVNPNLDGLDRMIPQLEQYLRDKGRSRA